MVPDQVPPAAVTVAQRSTRRHVLMAVAGLASGGVFLWLALGSVDGAGLRRQAHLLDLSLLVGATALYWLALSLRVLRWQLLLRQLGAAPLALVAETLVVGYAVNNVLPARLGEVARAAYAKRRLGIGRARVFGSIVIERLLDLLAILSCLGGGLLLFAGGGQGPRIPTFELIAINAGVVIGIAVLALVVLRSGGLDRIPLPAPVLAVSRDFRVGIAALNRQSATLAVVLSAAIWLFEVCALVQIFHALQLSLTLAQGLLLMGAASLSTLVPTAPGYLGTYQLVFVLAMRVFGLPESAGVVASTAIQLCLFGSVTVAGGVLLGWRALRRWRASLVAAVAVD